MSRRSICVTRHCWCRWRKPWLPCRWWFARSPRCWPASTIDSTRLGVLALRVWKPLLAASGFAFAVSLGEFGATSFLAREGSPTLPVVIFRLIGHPGEMNYGMALAASVVLALTTAVVMLGVERLRVPTVGAL